LPLIDENGATIYMVWGDWDSGYGDIKSVSLNGGGDDFDDVSAWNMYYHTSPLPYNIVTPSILLIEDDSNSSTTQDLLLVHNTFTVTATSLVVRMYHKVKWTQIGLYTGFHGYVGIGDVDETWSCSSASSMGWASNVPGYESCIYQGASLYGQRIMISDSEEGDVIPELPDNEWTISELHIDWNEKLVYRWFDKNKNELNTTTSERYIGLYANDSRLYLGKAHRGDWYIDWIFVRRPLNPEPTIVDVKVLWSSNLDGLFEALVMYMRSSEELQKEYQHSLRYKKEWVSLCVEETAEQLISLTPSTASTYYWWLVKGEVYTPDGIPAGDGYATKTGQSIKVRASKDLRRSYASWSYFRTPSSTAPYAAVNMRVYGFKKAVASITHCQYHIFDGTNSYCSLGRNEFKTEKCGPKCPKFKPRYFIVP